MTTPSITASAHLIAKILAHRPTPQGEVAGLIRNVHDALLCLDEEAVSAAVTVPAPATAVTPPQKQSRRAAAPRRASEPTAPEPAPAPVPKLVRRAEVAAAPVATVSISATANTPVRGVVKWFDPRTKKGALRLPGFAGDVALEPRVLAESGIARLFKGQEIDATLSPEEGAPRVQRLALPGAAAAPPIGRGVVHGRHAKPVLVELKREALRRVAARAEAEHLLGSNRSSR